MKSILSELELTKTDVRKMIEDQLSTEMNKLEKKLITKKDIKEMIRKTIVAQYKYLWEKSAFFINNI